MQQSGNQWKVKGPGDSSGSDGGQPPKEQKPRGNHKKKIILDRTQTLEDRMVVPLDLIEIITTIVIEVVAVEVVGMAFKGYAVFIRRLEIIILMLRWKIY